MVGFLDVRHVFHDGLSAYHGFTRAKVRKNITVSKNFPGSTPDYFSTFAQSVDLQSVTSVLRGSLRASSPGSLQACFRFVSSVVRISRMPRETSNLEIGMESGQDCG